MENLTLNYLQRAINKIDGITVGDSNPSDRYFMKFIEEVGELSESIRKDKRMSNDEIKGTIEEELYDILYYIIRLANVYNLERQITISRLVWNTTNLFYFIKFDNKNQKLYI